MNANHYSLSKKLSGRLGAGISVADDDELGKDETVLYRNVIGDFIARACVSRGAPATMDPQPLSELESEPMLREARNEFFAALCGALAGVLSPSQFERLRAVQVDHERAMVTFDFTGSEPSLAVCIDHMQWL
jgi:hypothetical protein